MMEEMMRTDLCWVYFESKDNGKYTLVDGLDVEYETEEVSNLFA